MNADWNRRKQLAQIEAMKPRSSYPGSNDVERFQSKLEAIVAVSRPGN